MDNKIVICFVTNTRTYEAWFEDTTEKGYGTTAVEAVGNLCMLYFSKITYISRTQI